MECYTQTERTAMVYCVYAWYLAIPADLDRLVLVPRVLQVHTGREVQLTSEKGRQSQETDTLIKESMGEYLLLSAVVSYCIITC